MPTYEITAPNGKVFEVTAPAGATRDQVLAYAKQQFSNAKPDQSRAIQQDMERMADPTSGMSGVDKFRAGMGKALTDVGRGVGQLLGQVSRQDVEESRKLDQPLMRTGAGMAGNIVGNVAAAAPTAFIPGANTITGAGAIGAGMGLLQPSASTSETLKNVGVGGVAGAAIPALMTAGRVAKSFVEPFYESGRAQIMGRALRQSAGDQADEAMRAMQGARELVPGSFPTAGEAAGNPGIAAMQRTATAIDPVAMNQMAARQAAQNEARIAALQGITPDAATAKTAREAATSALYQSTEQMPVKMTPELEKLMARPSMQKAFSRAEQLAAEAGETIDTQNLTGKAAHYIKMALDDLSSASPATGIGGNELRAIKSTRGDYLKALEAQIPAYGSARTTYAQMSRPVNQAEIGQEIANKAINFRGEMTPAAYSRALQDTTAKRVTGQPMATMAGAMEPNQMTTLQAIKDDLLRSEFAKTAGKGVGSDTVQKLAFSNMLNAAGIPSALRSFGPAGAIGNIAQRFGQVAYKDANERMAAELAQALLDPQTAATLMQSGMVTPQMQALVKGLRSGGAALGASAPGLIQANQ